MEKEMSSGKIFKKRWVQITAVIILAGVIVKCIGPIAFVRDGLLTRKHVDDYKMQFDFGATRRHEAGITEFYLFNFGFEEISLQKEEMGEGYDMKIEKIMPFLYHWTSDEDHGIFRVTIGRNKYYYTICST